jgi:Ca2+-binding RTX toxin-like protein
MARIPGTIGSDEIFGTVTSDIILGYEGDDFIDGNGGPDRISPGPGDDTILVDGAASSWIEIRPHEGYDTIYYMAPELDFADLGRSTGDEDQAVQEPVGDFCALSVIR